MGIFKYVGDFFSGANLERKSSALDYNTHTVTARSPDEITRMVEDAAGIGDTNFRNSVVYACARVIAEDLALPPCVVHRVNDAGKKAAVRHPLYYLLNSSPNDRQSSYDFRSMIGFHLAMTGNAYVFINRLRDGTIAELLPCDPGSVSIQVDTSRLFNPVQYYLFGEPIPAANMLHLKGPSWLSWTGMNTVHEAARAIGLAAATETYGINLFRNGAQPGGFLSPRENEILKPEQALQIKAQWDRLAVGVGNAHKTVVLPSGIDYTPATGNSRDAQWIENRRYQTEEICRFFRVSPTKIFQDADSQSYASVEQAHIAHDQDSASHWQTRFVQSCNMSLLTDADRRLGYTVTIDNQLIQSAPAGEKMAFVTAGLASGVLTGNEGRALLGFDPVDDPEADKLRPAANLFGPKTPDAPSTDEEPKNNG